jgi:hypothetical protein
LNFPTHLSIGHVNIRKINLQFNLKSIYNNFFYLRTLCKVILLTNIILQNNLLRIGKILFTIFQFFEDKSIYLLWKLMNFILLWLFPINDGKDSQYLNKFSEGFHWICLLIISLFDPFATFLKHLHHLYLLHQIFYKLQNLQFHLWL